VVQFFLLYDQKKQNSYIKAEMTSSNSFNRLLIAGMLVIAVAFAITRPPQNHYPTVVIEATELAGTIKLGFLFESHSSMAECETLIGNIARTALMKCPQCRITLLSCETVIDQDYRNLLGTAPLPYSSGHMANGAVTFYASSPELALSICKATEAQSAKSANPVKCYASNTHRPKIPGPSPLNAWVLTLPFAAFFATWLVGWLIIRYEHIHAHFSHDCIDSGPQKYHTEPTPRIGGIAVMAGLLMAGGVMLFSDTIQVERPFGLLLLASIPAFLGGLVEDVTKKVGVPERLLLTMLSGAIAAWLLGAVLIWLDIPGIDHALTWLPFAVVLTAFAVGGIANAINIIDGFNGLASGYALIVLAAIAFVANCAGDSLIFATSITLAGAILGFLVWNWPGGKIFLGDGGAYLVGFILAEISVLLVVRNPEVSPWLPLLLLIYPIFETFYSVYRRKFQNNLSPGQPDNQHLHQLIHDRLIRTKNLDKTSQNGPDRNSQVAKYLWAPTVILAIAGAAAWQSTEILAACVLVFCVFYVVNYRRIAANDNKN
jgi:UDP-N-acetylmuramyl pentapeptide phosphotransferase/UDP-N-acetylglucosamine-1-phosphate transferase